jgi:nitrogen fixation protein
MFSPVYKVNDQGEIYLSTNSFSVSYDQFKEDEVGNAYVIVKSEEEPVLKVKLLLHNIGNAKTQELEIKNKSGLGLVDIRFLHVKIKKFKNGWGAKIQLPNGELIIKGDIPKHVKLQVVRKVKLA